MNPAEHRFHNLVLVLLLRDSRRHRGGVALRHPRDLGRPDGGVARSIETQPEPRAVVTTQHDGRVLELVLPHAHAYAPRSAMFSVAACGVFALSEPPQPTTVGIGTVAPPDGSGRIVKNVQSERNPDRTNTFL